MNQIMKGTLKGALIGVVVGGGISYGIIDRIGYKHFLRTDSSRVTAGYVIPSELEIDVENLDRNGLDEVVLKYDGKSYLFMVDEQGKPVAVPYEVKQMEIIPNK